MIGRTWLCTLSENDKCMYHNVVSVIIHYYGILSLKVEVPQQGLISDGCKTMANKVKKTIEGRFTRVGVKAGYTRPVHHKGCLHVPGWYCTLMIS